ncbi:MAG: hypothetical protein M9913_23930 [Bryobacteraceae bacterium]|nr:hypothetical protein [Bryobacteraceae bacterium]
MQLTPQLALLQTAHVFQQHLFPRLEAELGTLSPQLQPQRRHQPHPPESALHARLRPHHADPPAIRVTALATAFLAKAVLNLPHHPPAHRPPQDRLPLRRLCGWHCPTALPHESKFSRAFALFAHSELPQ